MNNMQVIVQMSIQEASLSIAPVFLSVCLPHVHVWLRSDMFQKA